MSKFKIPVQPTYTVKSVRFPDNMVDRIEKNLVGTNCSFSAFVVEAVRSALEDLDEDDK